MLGFETYTKFVAKMRLFSDASRTLAHRWISAGPPTGLKLLSRSFVFLVTSTVRPSANPLSYINVRSVFTCGQRLAQTVKTARSIRAAVPDALIVLLENSALLEDEVKTLSGEFDLLALFADDPVAARLRDGPHKGAGELYMLLQANAILRPFDYVKLFKMSGRYCLTDRFQVDNFPVDRFGFLYRDGSYSTRLYCVPKCMGEAYERQLRKALAGSRRGTSIEQLIMRGVPAADIQSLDCLGICGRIAVDGGLIME